MALSEYEIAILRSTISQELPDSEEELSISKAIELVRFCENLIKNTETSNTALLPLKEMFENPSKVLSTAIDENRPAELSKPTVGDARQKIIELVGINITWQTQKLQINNGQIGWDTNELMKQVSEMSQNDVEIIPPQEPVSNDEMRQIVEILVRERLNNIEISTERIFQSNLEFAENEVKSIQKDVEKLETAIQNTRRLIEERPQTVEETSVWNRQLDFAKSQKENLLNMGINRLSHITDILVEKIKE